MYEPSNFHNGLMIVECVFKVVDTDIGTNSKLLLCQLVGTFKKSFSFLTKELLNAGKIKLETIFPSYAISNVAKNLFTKSSR